MVELKNGILTVKINETGAELKSAVKDGIELMWQGIPGIWSGTSPLLFPICGGLKDNKYILKGKEYTIPKHGFAMNTLFEVESVCDTSAVFLLKSDEETKFEGYPFKFELRVIYTLQESSIKVEYRVNNTDNQTMYFSIGSHEAYSTPTGIENYDVILSCKETLDNVKTYGDLLSYSSNRIIKDSDIIPLYEKHFFNNGIVFTNIKSKSVTLRNRMTGKSVKVDFPFADNLLLWHSYSAPFMCVEPWAGIPDYIDSDYDITKKPGIISLDEGKTYIGEHTITFFE